MSQSTGTRTRAFDVVLEDLQAVVAEKGDGYLYPYPVVDGIKTCMYVNQGQPSCLVGHVLDRRGLLDLINDEAQNTWGFMVTHAAKRFTLAARQVLTAAQKAQDDGQSWGDALIVAKEAAQKFGAQS